MNGKSISQIAFLLSLLIASSPASGDFLFRVSGGYFDDHTLDKEKTIKRDVVWIWKPQYPGGAPRGYRILLDCFVLDANAELLKKNGKGTAKNISFEGLDNGKTVEVAGKIKAKIVEGFGRGIRDLDLSSLAGQSAVIASARISVGKNIGPDERVICRFFVAEFE
ncbi:MAG: hypothetical protein O7A04_02830 [Acidobacteria bacterium]|nr:hypothetical protein [Acidobacteriota bacterium]